MKIASHSLLLLTTFPATMALAAPRATTPPDTAETAPSIQKFEQAVGRTENLQLPLNKVILYRQAATALAATDKPQAVRLLERALSDIDASEAAMRASGTLDDKTYRLMEFHRLPTIMLMEKIDPDEALRVLAPPSTADRDSAFWALFFSRLGPKGIGTVRDTAMHKLDYGVTPAVVAAYEVLQKSDPGTARTLGTAIVAKFANIDPAKDPVAVQSAFALLRLLRVDVGSLAPAMVLDPGLLPANSVRLLFDFIGKAFLASSDPEMLILGENPAVYMKALEEYSPDTAKDVKLLPFAAPDYKSLIFKPETPVIDANHPDPTTLTPEQQQLRASAQAQINEQYKETQAQTTLLMAKINNKALPQKDRDNAVFAAVDQANRFISLARSYPNVLDREAFKSGELEIYNFGTITNVVDSISAILQAYAAERPKVAEDAAERLDGPEIRTEVGLQIAIREMTGDNAYLTIQPKRQPFKVPQRPPALPPAPPLAPSPATLPAS
jgi:hypothetical protein